MPSTSPAACRALARPGCGVTAEEGHAGREHAEGQREEAHVEHVDGVVAECELADMAQLVTSFGVRDQTKIPSTPMMTWVTPAKPISSGVLLLVLLPSPSSPQVSSPQARTPLGGTDMSAAVDMSCR